MRQVILGSFVSLDGIMQAPGGPEEDQAGGFKHGGWTFPYFDETVGQALDETFSAPGEDPSLPAPYCLLLGRKTYDIFAAYWPNYEGSENAEIARQFNETTKYVATSSNAPLAWRNSVAMHDPAKDVARLKQEAGPPLLIQGSSVLTHTLLAHDLIDEIYLFIFPVVLGSGKRLFGDEARALKLTSSRTSPSGVSINKYVPDGSVRTGSFA